MLLELLPSTKAWRTYVNPLVVGTLGIRAFDTDGMGEVTCAYIALVLDSGFVNSYSGTRRAISACSMYEKHDNYFELRREWVVAFFG